MDDRQAWDVANKVVDLLAAQVEEDDAKTEAAASPLPPLMAILPRFDRADIGADAVAARTARQTGADPGGRRMTIGPSAPTNFPHGHRLRTVSSVLQGRTRLEAAAFPFVTTGSLPVLALVLASLLWGTSDVAGKLALDAFPPVTLAALRFAIALALLWPLARRRGCHRVPARTAAPLGLLGVALAFLLQNVGLERTSASNASLLQGAVPVLTLALAAAVLGERPRRFGLWGAGTAMVGVATVTLPGGGGLRVPGIGDALVLASAGCFAAFAVLGRRAFPAHGTLPVLVGMAAWGTAGLAPAAAVELLVTRPASVGLRDAALVLYLAVGCSVITYGLWGFALRHTEAGRAAVFDSLVPVVGVAAAVLVLDEHPTIWQMTGGTLVVAGVWLATREHAPRAAEAPSVDEPTAARTWKPATVGRPAAFATGE